jgi:hypothetical protein
MSSILASNIPDSTPLSKIEHFFSFCGKIERIKSYDLSKGEGEQCVQVYFVNPSAVSTALLLNGAELDGKAVVVREFNDGNIPHKGVKSGGHAGEIAERQGLIEKSAESASEKSSVSSESGDIEQEHKPKSAIFAEYLAQGYVLGDHLISKAVDYDKKNGYSEKFNKFLADLDAKYKIQEKSKEIDAKIDETQKELDSKYKISESLNKYFAKAQKTELGGKIIDFYTKSVNDAREVHEEAKRLAELKKGAPITKLSPSDPAKAAQPPSSI